VPPGALEPVMLVEIPVVATWFAEAAPPPTVVPVDWELEVEVAKLPRTVEPELAALFPSPP